MSLLALEEVGYEGRIIQHRPTKASAEPVSFATRVIKENRSTTKGRTE